MQKQVTAVAQRIQELEEMHDKMQKKREQEEATTAATTNNDLSGEIAKLQAAVQTQKTTLEVLSSQHCGYDSTLKEMKQIKNKLTEVERGVADSSSRAAATAEKQELLKVLPAVVLDLPKGSKTEAIAAIDAALSQGMQEAEKKKQHVPKDMSFSCRPFGSRRVDNNASSSKSTKQTRENEKMLVSFMSAEAAAFFVKNKRKLPEGIYAEPMLTSKEQKAKSDKFATFRALKARGRHVTWHRAVLVEYTTAQGSGIGRWREVTAKEDILGKPDISKAAKATPVSK
jgi:hypothetical protein